MKFIELLRKVDFNQVLNYLEKDKDEKSFLEEYKQLYDSLLNKTVKNDNDLKLFLVWQKEYFGENEEYIEVLGYSEKDNERYALDFMDRERWLGLDVLDKSLNEFGDVIFVAECLKEMSFISFVEEVIENEKNILNERVKAIEDGTEEYVDSETVFKELREKYGFEYKEPTEEEQEERRKKTEKLFEYNKKRIEKILN